MRLHMVTDVFSSSYQASDLEDTTYWIDFLYICVSQKVTIHLDMLGKIGFLLVVLTNKDHFFADDKSTISICSKIV